jgi:hypothetical protein
MTPATAATTIITTKAITAVEMAALLLINLVFMEFPYFAIALTSIYKHRQNHSRFLSPWRLIFGKHFYGFRKINGVFSVK